VVSVVTQPYARPRNAAADNYRVTLAREFDLAAAVKRVEAPVDLSEFLRVHPSGRARIWAVGVSAPARRAWSRMSSGDLVLFYGSGAVYAWGRLATKTYWPRNNHIWPTGDSWDHIYSLSEFHELPPDRQLDYQSLRKLTPKLDVFSVGCRDIGDFGGSEDRLLDWVTTTGPRRQTPEPPRTPTWDIEPGTVIRRSEVHRRFGGSKQSGISSSARTPNVMVFSDPEVGRVFGYDKHEGRRDDGSYRYTGEGQVGNQTETSQGNAALLSAEDRGKAIRLFITNKRNATYIGEYTLGEPKFTLERANDRDGEERNVLVFNFVPVSTEAALPSAKRQDESRDQSNQYSIATWNPPNDSEILVQPSAKEQSNGTISRKEMQLQGAYGRWLESRGKVVKQLSIPIDDGAAIMRPDLYNETDRVVIEAKKSNGRKYVREAIGQVLDYVHSLKRCIEPLDVKPAILLPARPADDLVDLCSAIGIILVYQRADTFDSC